MVLQLTESDVRRMALGQSFQRGEEYYSCPYDWGGICKHIVAVLLTMVRKPDTVEKLAPPT